jgi:hypothetical protein
MVAFGGIIVTFSLALDTFIIYRIQLRLVDVVAVSIISAFCCAELFILIK